MIHYGLAAVVGAFYAIAFIRFVTPDGGPPLKPVLVVSSVVLLAVGFTLGRRVKPISIIGVCFFAGIGTGVIANAAVGEFVTRSESHNLLPFELIIVAAFAMPGFISGLVLAWLTRRFTPRSS